MNKPRLFFFSVLYVALFFSLQSVLKQIGLGVGVIPDFIVILILFISFYEMSPFGAFLVFIIGLLVDVSGGILLGPWAGAYVLCFGIFAFIANRMFIDSWVTIFPFAFAIVIASNIIYLLITYDPIIQISTEWYRIGGKALVTMLCAPLFLMLLKWIFQVSGSERGKYSSSRRY